MAFAWCNDLKTICIPESVTIISKRAFFGCVGLTNINIPKSVTSIGFYSFVLCTNLITIQFNSATTAIEEIDDNEYTIPYSTEIIGFVPSTAKDYAAKYGRTFKEIVTLTGLSLNKNISTINVGANENLTATITPDNATDKSVTWSVYSQSGSNIATVSDTGLITAVNPGIAVIRATSNADGTKYSECHNNPS